MNDPVLGTLVADSHLSGCLVASVPFEGRAIELRLDPNGAHMEACLILAREVVASLKGLEGKAATVAAAHLITEYNQSWRHFSRSRSDGSMEEVTHAELNESELARRLNFVSLLVSQDVDGSMVEFCFGDDGLFAGHSIFVTSFDGAAFQDTHVMLFG
jgi:hypothetical protein